MHPMFLPENLYSFADAEQNMRRVEAFVTQLNGVRSYERYEVMTQKAHWFLCAFYHGAKPQFEQAQRMISTALDAAEDRVGGAA